MESTPRTALAGPLSRCWRFVAVALITTLLGACGGGDAEPTASTQATADTTALKAAATSTAASTSSVWLTVAKESAAFTVTGTQTVRFGAGGAWVEKSVSGKGQCTAAFFGQDPLAGNTRVCQQLQGGGSLLWRGVSLAGADFAPDRLPGNYGSDYIYPSADSVPYYKNKGMNIVRLPFLWERLQPTLNQPFDATELSRLISFVRAVTVSGQTVLLDPHNYARYRGNVIGSAAVPETAYADFWRRLATQFKGNARVIFGLMNEPHSMPTEQWLSAANAALAAIRSANASNVVFVPGNAWTGSRTWSDNWYGTPNSTVMRGVIDPGHNFVFEVHMYLDNDGSGSSATCASASIGVERLQNFTTWLRANRYRGFLGEMGAGANALCNQAVSNALAFVRGNADVWTGWTWWAGGPWWGNYIYSIEPSNGVDKPQMSVLSPYLN
ncbi:glycoside hydrolase family 5 protein [Ralstonia solanacearum]|uniref:glycoside hydrolase family 5 protein n=1 Tax=Ralstonia solanacearum TaxID=305 RepID=UPI0005AC0304|nr:glycoside hydrolase family 5 protein [Ralstonia solanacearum]MDB0529217.1 glycoside hydrolase family 5 protein [Ralstonia solanacearum]MDB0567439.1 glycoside hydrolase family 5 protein [Ralstonia solanacearum]MDB0577259.1 glycoside hydrolase family 5 protein [Ralstonia solanacearum]